MTKAELIREAARRSGLTQKETAKVVEAVTESVKQTLGRGDKVVLVNFGTFLVASRAGRTGRHPVTGQPLKVPAHRVPVFRAGKGLKEVL
jgi:DNA-binding protein HU-beta